MLRLPPRKVKALNYIGYVIIEMNYAEIAQAVVTLMAIPEPWVLSIDCTEWQFGDCVFNILMLGVVHSCTNLNHLQ